MDLQHVAVKMLIHQIEICQKHNVISKDPNIQERNTVKILMCKQKLVKLGHAETFFEEIFNQSFGL